MSKYRAVIVYNNNDDQEENVESEILEGLTKWIEKIIHKNISSTEEKVV